MNDELARWAVTIDPELHARALAAWDAGRLPLENELHDLGLRPDPEKGQRDSAFIYGTPEGERIVMWEPGPGPYEAPAELGDEDEGGEGWLTPPSSRSA